MLPVMTSIVKMMQMMKHLLKKNPVKLLMMRMKIS